MHRNAILARLLLIGLFLPLATGSLFGQGAAPETAPAPVTFTTPEDHRNMLDQLGITKLHPGPNGNESAPKPVDSHQLIALCAPRLTFISYGIPGKGDAKWLDQQGSFMAAVAAGPAFRLLGAKDLGTSDDYLKEKMPAVNTGLLDGQLAWRQHDGGHTDGPNIEHFIKWADAHMGRATPAQAGN